MLSTNIRVLEPNDDIDTEREYPGFRADKEVYLVGGGPNLQQDFIERLQTPHLKLLIYKLGDFANLKRKIAWEQKALQYAHVVVFWFSEADAPETLFTLGRVLGGHRGPGTKIIVGVHPSSPHREFIKNQLIYVGGGTPGITAESLDELIEALEYYL